ncbi:hypothetical protein CWC15_16650 [Pseudoalteromonas spongiae]|nr:hypothetical protein CWC15_16650 [Pseudoalteromonas spongiae]
MAHNKPPPAESIEKSSHKNDITKCNAMIERQRMLAEMRLLLKRHNILIGVGIFTAIIFIYFKLLVLR